MAKYSVNHNKVNQSYKTWEPVWHVGYICYKWILYYSLFVKKQIEAKTWDQDVQHQGTFLFPWLSFNRQTCRLICLSSKAWSMQLKYLVHQGGGKNILHNFLLGETEQTFEDL